MCLIPDGSSPNSTTLQRQQMEKLAEKYAGDVACDKVTAIGELGTLVQTSSVHGINP